MISFIGFIYAKKKIAMHRTSVKQSIFDDIGTYVINNNENRWSSWQNLERKYLFRFRIA